MDIFRTLPGQLVLGAVLALLVALAAWRLKLLTLKGALGAFLLGGIVFGLGGLQWALVLIAFFATSSGLSFIFRKRKKSVEKMYAKGGTRDFSQVMANGGVAGLFVILHFIFPAEMIPWAGFCAALAAANADTWATELGILNRRKPVLIVSGKSVEPGTSGAISLAGTVAAGGGAFLIALLAWLFKPVEITTSWSPWLTLLVLLAGVAGSMMDSLLGATLQAVYFCPTCQKETEKLPRHGCGSETVLLRGKVWMNNEWVNLFCTLSASILTSVVCIVFHTS